ncbi:MAG TPA: hypothetical protein VFP84_31830 [Kofleriaceae bacterium]|nr:hypothetical protein [Kofleriaceae bacterium]
MSKPSKPAHRTEPQPLQPLQPLQTIDPTALAHVSGGAVTSTATTSNDQLATALTGILNSIQSLGQQRQGGFGLNPTEMLMFMMVMQQRNEQNVAAATGYPWGQPIVYY